MGFSAEAVATFIAVVGVLSVFAQTAVLGKHMSGFCYSSVEILWGSSSFLVVRWTLRRAIDEDRWSQSNHIDRFGLWDATAGLVRLWFPNVVRLMMLTLWSELVPSKAYALCFSGWCGQLVFWPPFRAYLTRLYRPLCRCTQMLINKDWSRSVFLSLHLLRRIQALFSFLPSRAWLLEFEGCATDLVQRSTDWSSTSFMST